MPMTKYYIETKDNYISSDSDNSGRSSLNRIRDNEDAHLNDSQSKDKNKNFKRTFSFFEYFPSHFKTHTISGAQKYHPPNNYDKSCLIKLF